MSKFDVNALNYLEKKALENIKVVDEDLYNAVSQLRETISQQEKKDKLLELYRKIPKVAGLMLEAEWAKIKALEEELK